MGDVATANTGSYSKIKRANELYNAGDHDGAYELTNQVLLEEPNDAQALCVVAAILKKAHRFPIAYQVAKRATDLKPERPEVWLALGHAAQQMWRIEEALSCYKKALQRANNKDQEVLYLNNIGSVHIDVGDYDKGETFVQKALAIDPSDRMARHNLALCKLSRREWKDAWPYYSSSIGTDNRRNYKYMPDPGEPTWDGTPNKTVVIYGEQGLGDEIVAASMLPDAIKDCGKVILDCDARLKGLLLRSFPKAVVYGTRWQKQLDWRKEDRQIDYSISGFEIGRFYRNQDADFPDRPYLIPCPDRLEMYRGLFASKGKPTIGIAWTGGTWTNGAKHRCLPLQDWKPIFDSIDAHWVSLQYKDASDDINGTPVAQYPYATLTKDYDDTAAMVAALDCVVSVPTAVVHLASALGVPTIAMQSQYPCWKFKGGLAWHPRAKLIDNSGSWHKTARDTADAIRQQFASHK